MRLVILLLVALLASCSSGESNISVVVGPTDIPRGDAIGENDITVNNGLFAVAFAVDTAPPWGVARGGIIDIAIVRNGELDYDIASLADFMPNNWSAWPTTYQEVEIESHTNDEVVIRTRRDWGDIDLDSRFHIRAGDSRIHIVTTMSNPSDDNTEKLLTGYVVWPDGGALTGDPIVGSSAEGATGWTAAYDENWALGLHAPYSDVTDYGGRDRYAAITLHAGASREFEVWLQIESQGSLAPMIETEIEFDDLASGLLRGTISTTDGAAVLSPAVIVSRNGRPLGWTVGRDGQFEMRLPVGTYAAHATAAGHGDSSSMDVEVVAGAITEVAFDDVQLPGSLQARIQSGETPVDARISIEEGPKPAIAYHGRDVFFTELDPVGELTVQLAPGDYVFGISTGGGFTSMKEMVEIAVHPGESSGIGVDVPTLVRPSDDGWYSADLHHHSDVLDGFTEAEYVLRSQLAAGVDITFLSDHDSVINNAEMRTLSEARGTPFIAGTELSPSWGHFNAWPLNDDAEVEIDTGQATVTEVFSEARRMGADAVAVNHPYNDYGYFNNLNNGSVTGEYDEGFDLVEISPEAGSVDPRSQNHRTVEHTWALWNEGKRAYLAAGSDAHDVWQEESGSARSYVYVEGDFTEDKFVEAILAGNSYASQGPLIYPEILFGTQVSLEPGEVLELKYKVVSVTGLNSVTLIERGQVVAIEPQGGHQRDVSFVFTPGPNTWYSLIVEDIAGRVAYTNPVWVNSEAGTGGE